MAMTAKLTHKVTVRKSNSSSAKAVTTFKVGTKVTVTTTKADSKGNVWGKCSKGWFMMSKKNGKKITNVFGVTYEELIEKANEIFGVNHFIPDSFDSENYVSAIESLIVDNGLNGFDIIDHHFTTFHK